MIDAIAECGSGYIAPSYEDLRSTHLEKAKGEVHENFSKRLSDRWKETWVTILSDGRSKSLLIMLSVASSKGTHLLKSLDISPHIDDVYYLFELLDSVVEEIGVENVVQVITDHLSSFVDVGGLLLKKYPSLFWSPCASYCIEKMLEDISELEWISNVLEEARTVTRYIYNNS
ncbi:uncharacterized protein A4U43_C01F12370 [Asparagus officinalis]|uniref:DUF659 domain-containing protein n=1 Tax=Asparagus officinalis TaxID=4686 RepID=A0A5P1FSJ6_ASPOF|nr:uncharacterized protein A4U43_C01F12370 [Asparagus officinalis]